MKKKKAPKKRNVVVLNMISRRQKAGPHPNKKRKENKKACRGKVT
jgi:hypothetical protein